MEFLDHAQILSNSDEDAIKSQAQSMHLPDSVHEVLYATYPNSGEDFPGLYSMTWNASIRISSMEVGYRKMCSPSR